MSTRADQVRRMLVEVPYLLANPDVDVAEAAEVLGVSPTQLGKDLHTLWMCGLPGQGGGDLIEIDMDGLTDSGVIRLSNADYLSRPMRFTPDEATSLIVALRAVAELATGRLAAAAERAGRTLEELVAGAGAGRVELRLAAGDADVRERLGEAIDAGSRVRLVYDNASRGRTTRPLVDPAAIEVRGGAAYLHAWALADPGTGAGPDGAGPDGPADPGVGRGPGRAGWRTYRLDRISEVRAVGQAAADHGPAPVHRPWFDDAQQLVTLDLAARARWVVEYCPTTSVTELGDGAVRVTLPVADPAWLSGLLLRLGDEVLAVDPTGAAEDARERALAALELNRQLFGGSA